MNVENNFTHSISKITSATLRKAGTLQCWKFLRKREEDAPNMQSKI